MRIRIKKKNIKETFFNILTEYGTLNDWYRVEDLEPYIGGLVKVKLDDLGREKISLNEAAKLQGARTGSLEEVLAMCQCTGKCHDDNRCSCWRRKFKCTSHCHNSVANRKKKCNCLNK